MSRPVVALTIAGSDPSGGAGIQADLKTFSALGAFGTSVITALTAQSTQGVTGIHVVPTPFVVEQLETLVSDVRLDAVKIGMLANADVAGAVGAFLDAYPQPTVVLDPVIVATSGDRLVEDDAVEAIRALLPLSSVVTPNLAEAGVLLDAAPARTLAEMRSQALALRHLGAPRVLLKGGHLEDGDEAVDVFADGDSVTELRAPRVRTVNTHGTGCTLSSALAALRPQQESWAETAVGAKRWLTGALAAADVLEVGHGHGPVHHFHQMWNA
jgi:hydroxymethylpyrimidine/phosphomethylpyrimidine kinase